MRNFPSSTFFAEVHAAEANPSPRDTAAIELEHDPFAPSAHTQAMIDAGSALAPLVVIWDYRVVGANRFAGWLATKDILLRSARLAQDPKLAGVRYGGTYRLASAEPSAHPRFRTQWGYTDEAAMQAMHGLCEGTYDRATIVQIDLIEFVRGIREQIAAAGDDHFSQQVMVTSSTLLSG